jgi:hypothetical protein
MVDGHKKVSLSTIENPSPTIINANLSPKEEMSYIKLITKYQDIFTSSYDESLTFMHDSSSYNQIQIAPEDEEKIVFQ